MICIYNSSKLNKVPLYLTLYQVDETSNASGIWELLVASLVGFLLHSTPCKTFEQSLIRFCSAHFM